MSIINDALKKIQENMGQHGVKTEAPPKGETPTAGQEKNILLKKKDAKDAQGKKKKIAPATLAMQIFCLLVIIAVIVLVIQIYWPNAIPRSQQRRFASIAQKIFPKKGYQAPPSPRSKPLPPGAIVLNGIMTNDDQKSALISGNIYEVGETINGYIIIDITTGKIQLSGDNQVVDVKVGDAIP